MGIVKYAKGFEDEGLFAHRMKVTFFVDFVVLGKFVVLITLILRWIF